MTSVTTINRHSVDEILEEYRQADFEPDFGPEGTRLLVKLYRQLASTGESISVDEVLAAAQAVGMSKDDALSFLGDKAERGEHG